jgi:hypothetical protein
MRFIGDPTYTRRRWQLFIAALVLTVAADLLVTKGPAAFFWQHLPGWNALFGLVSCLLIIFISKFLGYRCGLMREEDYYDE